MTTKQILDKLVPAYLEAVVFTDFGEVEQGQPPADAEFAPEAIAKARADCDAFYEAGHQWLDEGCTLDSFIHDFWFTRNGHGTGFWDRPEKWGEEGAEKLTELSKKFGEVWTYQGDDGLVYFG